MRIYARSVRHWDIFLCHPLLSNRVAHISHPPRYPYSSSRLFCKCFKESLSNKNTWEYRWPSTKTHTLKATWYWIISVEWTIKMIWKVCVSLHNSCLLYFFAYKRLRVLVPSVGRLEVHHECDGVWRHRHRCQTVKFVVICLVYTNINISMKLHLVLCLHVWWWLKVITTCMLIAFAALLLLS